MLCEVYLDTNTLESENQIAFFNVLKVNRFCFFHQEARWFVHNSDSRDNDSLRNKRRKLKHVLDFTHFSSLLQITTKIVFKYDTCISTAFQHGILCQVAPKTLARSVRPKQSVTDIAGDSQSRKKHSPYRSVSFSPLKPHGKTVIEKTNHLDFNSSSLHRQNFQIHFNHPHNITVPFQTITPAKYLDFLIQDKWR